MTIDESNKSERFNKILIEKLRKVLPYELVLLNMNNLQVTKYYLNNYLITFSIRNPKDVIPFHVRVSNWVLPEKEMIKEYCNLIRLLKLNWLHSTKLVVLDATFPWSLSPSIKTNVSIDCFQRNCWSKKPAIWFKKR